MGISLGVGLAMIIGGKVITVVQNAPNVVLPVVGELYAWQAVFIVVGLPGLVIAALMITVKEPKRKERYRVSDSGASDRDDLSLSTAMQFFGTRWKMYASHFFGMSTVGILSYGFYAWIPTMFIRTWNWSILDIGRFPGFMAHGTIDGARPQRRTYESGVISEFAWDCRRCFDTNDADAATCIDHALADDGWGHGGNRRRNIGVDDRNTQPDAGTGVSNVLFRHQPAWFDGRPHGNRAVYRLRL